MAPFAHDHCRPGHRQYFDLLGTGVSQTISVWVIFGLHLFTASDEQLNWTGDKLKEFKVANLLGAHCTGIEAVYRLRQRAGLTRKSAIVGSVGSTFTLGEGIRAGMLAK